MSEYRGPERRRDAVSKEEVEEIRHDTAASKAEIEEMRVAQLALDHSVRGLNGQLASLDTALRDFATRRDIERDFYPRTIVDARSREAALSRQQIAELLVVGIVVTIQGHDLHVEKCRPIQANGEIGRPSADLTRAICDVTFPTHSHALNSHELSPANHFGLFLYAVAALALFADLWRRRIKKKRAEQREKGRGGPADQSRHASGDRGAGAGDGTVAGT